MHARTLLALAILASTVIPVSAHAGHNYSRAIFAPTGPFVGAAIDVSDLDDSTPLSFAYGTCTVTPASPNTDNVLDGSPYSFTCGVDRDDDGFVTNVDLDGAEDPSGFDDDFASGGVGSDGDRSTIDVCLRRDATGGGGDWDDVSVFVSANGAPVAAGVFDVALSLTDATSCSPGPSRTGPLPTSRAVACSEEYDHGVVTTQPCPPDLCGLNQGFVAIDASGPAAGTATVGRLTCHDASHQVTGTFTTRSGNFDDSGRWRDVAFQPINGGTHPHCTIDSIGDADYALVQCGKV
jgi:hypothetical protein